MPDKTTDELVKEALELDAKWHRLYDDLNNFRGGRAAEDQISNVEYRLRELAPILARFILSATKTAAPTAPPQG